MRQFRPQNTMPFTAPAFYADSIAQEDPPGALQDPANIAVIGPASASYRGECHVRLDFEAGTKRPKPIIFRAPKAGYLVQASVTVHGKMPVEGDVIITRAPAGQRGFEFADFVTLEALIEEHDAAAGYDVDFQPNEYRFNKGDALSAQLEVDGAFIDAVFTLFFSVTFDAN